MKAKLYNDLFDLCIADYHELNNVDQVIPTPYGPGSFEALLYSKAWIDAVQWHLEDQIRSPSIPPENLVALKRRIDKSNQDRTDTVEKIDDTLFASFENVKLTPGARMNSETPAWLIDRMSILALKVFHMREQTMRKDVEEKHRAQCGAKLKVLLLQRLDMAQCLDELIEDLGAGRRYMKVYRQMKMYNDQNLNPVLYGEKAKG